MSTFDATFFAAVIAIVGSIIGCVLSREKVSLRKRFVISGAIAAALLLGLCALACNYQWSSDILSNYLISKPITETDNKLNKENTAGDVTETDGTLESNSNNVGSVEDQVPIEMDADCYRVFDSFKGKLYSVQEDDGVYIQLTYCGSCTFPGEVYTKTVYLYCTNEVAENSTDFTTYFFSEISYGAQYIVGDYLYTGGAYIVSSSGDGAYLYKIQPIESTKESGE